MEDFRMAGPVYNDDPVCDYWHVYSDGTKLTQLFTSDEDYIYGVNRIAICAHAYGLKVIVYALMESHVHAVLKGKGDDVLQFITNYKKSLNTKFPHIDKGQLSFAYRAVKTVKDLRNSIVYVYRNPLEISNKIACWNYSWGIGNIVFNPQMIAEGECLSSFSGEKIRQMLETRIELPGEWRLKSGQIQAASFVDVKEFEQAFENSVQLFFVYLRLKKDERQEIFRSCNVALANNLSYRDLASRMNRACRDYAGKDLAHCSFGERLAVAREKIKEKEICVSANLAKLLGVDMESLQKLL